MPTARKRTWRSAAKAHEKAKELGPLEAVEPDSRRSDGSPRVGLAQVYVTRTGEVFHPAWCSVVGGLWDDNPAGLFVIAETTVGSRRPCKSCNEPLQA